MPKKTVSNNIKKRRRKLRLKKGVRRTIAALMLITALIVAAVPVRDVSAVSSEDLRGVILNNSLVDKNDTAVPQKTDVYYSFPCLEVLEPMTDVDGNSHGPLYKIDVNGMDDNVFAVFEMQKDGESILNNYIGEQRYSDYFPYSEVKGVLNLDRDICCTDSNKNEGDIYDDFYYVGDDGQPRAVLTTPNQVGYLII